MKMVLVFLGLAQILVFSLPSYSMDISQCSADLHDYSGAPETVRREACQKASKGRYGMDCLFWGISSTGVHPAQVASVCANVNSPTQLHCMENHVQSIGGSVANAAHACRG